MGEAGVKRWVGTRCQQPRAPGESKPAGCCQVCDRVRFAVKQTHLATLWGQTPGGAPGLEQVQRLQRVLGREGALCQVVRNKQVQRC